MKDLEKEVSLDGRDAVAGGVPDMEDIASDMETDCVCDDECEHTECRHIHRDD